jgi:hypothetical protein
MRLVRTRHASCNSTEPGSSPIAVPTFHDSQKQRLPACRDRGNRARILSRSGTAATFEW